MQYIEDCWIRNTVLCTDRESLWHPLLIQCLKRAWWFSQYCINLLRKLMRTDLLLC